MLCAGSCRARRSRTPVKSRRLGVHHEKQNEAKSLYVINSRTHQFKVAEANKKRESLSKLQAWLTVAYCNKDS